MVKVGQHVKGGESIIGYRIMRKKKTTDQDEKGDLHPSQPLHHRKSLLRVLGHCLRLSGTVLNMPPSPSCWHRSSMSWMAKWLAFRAPHANSESSMIRWQTCLLWSRSGPAGLQLGPSALRPIRLAGRLSLRRLRGPAAGAGSMSWPPPGETKYFKGLPIPAAAAMIALTILLYLRLDRNRLGQRYRHSGHDLRPGLLDGLDGPVLQFQGTRPGQAKTLQYLHLRRAFDDCDRHGAEHRVFGICLLLRLLGSGQYGPLMA